jgi:hypothetical protein
MAVVYQHIRKDTNEVFYVGIGATEKRAYSKNGRNQHWKNIVNKVEYYVEIIYHDLEWSLACNMEQYLIEAYGRVNLKTGCLVNLTNGGEGTIGRVVSNETKYKISQFKKGTKHSKETLLKMSENHKGQIAWNKGKTGVYSEDTIKKISDANIGKKHSDNTKKKMSDSHKSKKEGFVHPLKGKKPKYDTIKKLIENNANAKKVINTETNEVYNSLSDLCRILALNRSTMGCKLSGHLKNNTPFKYI